MFETVDDVEFRVRTLGALEAKVVLAAENKKVEEINVAFALGVVGDREQAVRVLQRLEKKGWLQRVAPGRYLLYPSELGHLDLRYMTALKFASAIVPEGYVGWWAAAAHHGLTWQRPTSIFIAIEKQKREREFEGFRIVFVKQKPGRFYGVERDGRDNFKISSVAKTVADCIDRIDLAGGVAEAGIILGSGIEKAGLDAVVDETVRLGSTSALQRLGFLLDVVRPDLFHAECRTMLKNRITAGQRSRLGRETRENGDFGFVADWGLQVNVNAAMLKAETDRFGRKRASTGHIQR
ncbi:type IV toxin-antitoxin system AbiEi family antitoxin [Rhizobium sp. MHM7A]|uniref:type IV toxin-antitoxin system AbiEi family antitoxin n=1 Tax=Rhizobium sp. MHM7A TaxID=2583233 RepID=UPI001487133F|nr:type IV toxin-antitoxin system AbiEi family antitoxin [Rhizobium sp. MHM7A]